MPLLCVGPCLDENIFFQCPRDYPNSCIHQKLQCNGVKECPTGDDERACQGRQFFVESMDVHRVIVESSSAGMPIVIIILAVIAFLFIVCVLSTGRLNEHNDTFRPRCLLVRSFDVLLLSSSVHCHRTSSSSDPQRHHDRK